MATQGYLTQSQRIGRWKGGIVGHAIPQETLARYGRQIKMPLHSSDTIIQRRWLPYGATATNGNSMNRFFQDANGDRSAAVVAAHQTAEGITNIPDTITAVDINCVMIEYSCLYSWTDKVEDVYEDDVPEQMKKQIGERVTYVNEQIIYGVVKAGTNQYYGGSGTSIATVNGKITLPLLRRITENLKLNHAMMVTSVLKPSPNYGTDAVRMGWVVVIPTSMQADCEDLPKYVPIENYASGKPMPNEIGKCSEFRFITHPDLPALQNAGAAIGTTGLRSTSGSLIDVYPFIVMAEDCFGQVAFRGMSALDPTYLSAKEKTKSDPHGQRGYAGTKWWKGVYRENEGWMACGNVGVTTQS